VRIYRDQFVTRVLGTATGIGFLAMGAYALLGAGEGLDPYIRDRAEGFALATLVGGVWAIAISWLQRDLGGVWCKAPKTWRRRHDRTSTSHSPPAGEPSGRDEPNL